MICYAPRPLSTIRKNGFRPTLELLENRDCPSAAPSLSLMVMSAPGERMVSLSGHVTDEVPAGRTVTFTGQYSGTALTNASGNYSVTVQAAALGTISATTTDPEGQLSNTAQGQVTSNAPTISNFTATRLSGTTYTFSGYVMDESPGGRTVTFGGLPSLQGQTVTTAANGSFSRTLQLAAGESGTATARTTDCWGLVSPLAQTTVTQPLNSAPTINLTLTQGSQKTVTLSGQVFDESPGGLTVVFTGQYSGNTVTNSNGTFSLTVQAAGLGTINAQTTDAQGLASNVVQQSVTSSAPSIINFTATRSVNTVYIFTGQVLDESAAGLTVSFGGLQSLLGKTATVAPNGTFSLTVELAQGEEGCATAQTTDWWGLVSQVAEALVSPA